MVNKITHAPERAPAHNGFSIVHGITNPVNLPSSRGHEHHDLFIDDRSRILITKVAPNQSVTQCCHIHASKRITILDGYAEVEMPTICIKLFEGHSLNIPNGTAHEIINLGKIPLRYVEIRTGPYVMDDDQVA